MKKSVLFLVVLFLLPLVPAYGVTFYNPAWNPQDGKIFESISSGQTYSSSFSTEGLAVTFIAFSIDKDARSAGLSVHNMRSMPDFYPASDNNLTYQYIEIKPRGFATFEMIRLSIEFAVSKEWLSDNNLSDDSMALFFWSSQKDSWVLLPTKLESSSDESVVYSSMTTSPSKYYIIASLESSSDGSVPVRVVDETSKDPSKDSVDDILVKMPVVDDDSVVFDSLPPVDSIGVPESKSSSEDSVEQDDSSSNLTYLFFVGVFVLVSFIIYFIVTGGSSGTAIDKEIFRYIKESKKHGKSKEQIRERLLKVGWNHERVDKALSKHSFSEPKTGITDKK